MAAVDHGVFSSALIKWVSKVVLADETVISCVQTEFDVFIVEQLTSGNFPIGMLKDAA